MLTGRPTKQRPDRQRVEELLCRELTRARAISPQVLQYLLSTFDIQEDEVATWLAQELPKRESYEVELLLSPLFTPDFETRSRFEEALGDGCLDPEDVRELIAGAASRGLTLALVHADGGRTELEFPEVVIERFVRLLHLDSPAPVDRVPAFADMDVRVRCYLRDPAWQREKSRQLLPVLLDAAERTGGDFYDYVRFLTDFVRTHRPASPEDCRSYLGNLQEAYERDLRDHETGARSFFNEELKAAYAGKWSANDDVIAAHKRMISMTQSLRVALS